MTGLDRRTALCVCFAMVGLPVRAQDAARPLEADPSVSLERWLELVASAKSIDSPLYMGRFKDPMYFLLAAISWTPRFLQASKLTKVTAPKGFVTDLASIPQIFYSLLRPDGEYAYAAILHDYLYWEQTTSRNQADETLKAAMEDLKVDRLTIETIYTAVSVAGQKAWDENRALKQQGEKRVLGRYPPNAGITWEEWKKDPTVFLS
jgi:hypothetical protein